MKHAGADVSVYTRGNLGAYILHIPSVLPANDARFLSMELFGEAPALWSEPHAFEHIMLRLISCAQLLSCQRSCAAAVTQIVVSQSCSTICMTYGMVTHV